MSNIQTLPTEGELKVIRQTDQTSVMYETKLKLPCQLFDNSGDRFAEKYKTTCHIFTENEINRANVRFFVETDESVRNRLVQGYLGVTTFINKQGSTVTRYITNLNTPSGVQTVLLTAREYRRSMDRYDMVYPKRNRWWTKLGRFFKK